MRYLARLLALNAALIVTGLTVQASASSFGECRVRCSGAGLTTYTIDTTQADCCSGNYTNHCPAGSTPVTLSWNSTRCGI